MEKRNILGTFGWLDGTPKVGLNMIDLTTSSVL